MTQQTSRAYQPPPASNFSSPSSETSESNTLQKIHSFSSITQLYFKFNSKTSPKQQQQQQQQQQQPHYTTKQQQQPTKPDDHQQRLSSVNSLSSSYSNQSNLYLNNRLASPASNPLAIERPQLPIHAQFSSPPQKKPSGLPAPRKLNHQSSLPRFSQPALRLRPRLNSTSQNSSSTTTTPLLINKKSHSLLSRLPDSLSETGSHPPTSTYHNHNNNYQSIIQSDSSARTTNINCIPTSQPSLYYRPGSPSAASSTSHDSSTSSLPLSTTASSVSCSKNLIIPLSSTTHLKDSPSTQPIHVIVRLRDQTKPNPANQTDLVSFDNETITLRIPVSMTNTNQQVNSYEFKVDKVIYPTPKVKKNEKVYERCSIESRLLVPFLNGFNSSLIAYGQTGSGKSFTLGSDNDPTNSDGLIPKTLERLFVNMASLAQKSKNETVELMVSFIEIYNDEIIDLLLNPPSPDSAYDLSAFCPPKTQKKVPIKINEDKSDGSIDLVGCKKLKINDLNQAMSLFNHGLNQRSIGFTQMNQSSSRSHAIFTLHLISSSSSSADPAISSNSAPSSNLVKKTSSKFQFVDLAGSERINKTKNLLGGDRFKEGIFINAGLHSLGNVISALSNQPSSTLSQDDKKSKKKNHIPYRESKLTRLLKDCLGGNSKTILISCISQNAQDLNESLNTLRYAIRAKKIENVSQKTTKVISTPSIIPMGMPTMSTMMSRVGSSKSKLQPLGGTRRLQNGSMTSMSSRTVTSRAGTVVMPTGAGRREIKKPMVMMKHELSKIKALKAIVSKGASSHSSSSTPALLNDDDDSLCPAVYLAEQVHKFFLLNQNSQVRLHGPFSRPIKIDSQLVNILKSHFAIQLPSAVGASSGLSKQPTSSAVMIHRNSRIVSSYSNPLTHSIGSSVSTSSHNNNPSSLVMSATPSTESEGQGGPPTLVDDPFLLFLVDLNAFFCNSVSPPPSSTTTTTHPSSSIAVPTASNNTVISSSSMGSRIGSNIGASSSAARTEGPPASSSSKALALAYNKPSLLPHIRPNKPARIPLF
ncbi:Kinesin-like protein kif21b [Puccinia graminis f. sp. tritici]|uniref:Kinesin-like protein kif21b n=1 Tax=Puccinia graminis f. sp. tritici TaxID=56615 RepID=A0A5B0PL20_PUCGR|nr:Kinesin-like protein kif21b [Puccinia graminis f. sp. tritici]